MHRAYRASRLTWVLAATLSACFAPEPPPQAAPTPPAPVAPPTVEAPPIAPPPPDSGPNYVVSVLVGGAPRVTPMDDLGVLGNESLNYLISCKDSDNRPNDTLQWDAANRAPLCVRLVFAPPAKLSTGAGTQVEASEMLVPLGMPQLEGFVLLRSGDTPGAGFLGGDPVMLARIKQRAAGTLAMPARATPADVSARP